MLQVNYYADIIYTSAGVDPTQSQYVTLGSGVINLVMTLVSVSYWGWGWGALMSGSPNSPLTGRQKPLRPESVGGPSLGGAIVTLVKFWGTVHLVERLPSVLA